MKLHWLFNRFMAPADDGGSAGGGAVDRGDDFVPTDDDDDAAEAAAAKKAADDAAASKKAADEATAAEAAAAEDKGEKDEKGAKKDTRIPLSRHKEILDRERAQREAAEQELAKYKQGAKVAEVNEEVTKLESQVLALEKEYTKLLIDGEADKASAKMAEIRRLEREAGEKKATFANEVATARAVEQVRYDTTVERLEAAYPQLNPDHEDFDKTTTGEVLELKEAYQLKGYTPSAAIQKAVKYVMGVASSTQKRATETEARVDKDDVAAARAKAQREKNLDAALKQPADTSKVGLDSDKAGGKLTGKMVMKMSQDEFMKLDEKTLAELRGDELV